MTNNNDWIKEFRNKFGQFYVSVDSKTGAIRIVDLEGGINVHGDDGTSIRCIASGDIEKYISQNFIPLSSLKKFIEENKKDRIDEVVIGDKKVKPSEDMELVIRHTHNSVLKLLKDTFIHNEETN